MNTPRCPFFAFISELPTASTVEAVDNLAVTPCNNVQVRMNGRNVPWERTVTVGSSDVDLLGHFQRIVDLDAEITHRAVEVGVSEQQLHGPEILGAPVDQGCLGST